MNIFLAELALNSTYFSIKFHHLFTCEIKAVEREGRVSTAEVYAISESKCAMLDAGHSYHQGSMEEMVL